MKIIIIVPIYNDGNRAFNTINLILKKSKRKIIIINDGSTDNTSKILNKYFENNKRITVLTHEYNYGKGAAMRTGTEKAWRMGANAVIFIDADGQHNPSLLPKFESAIMKNLLVFGYRKINNKMPFFRKIFNHLIQITVKTIFGIKKRDLLCGFLAIRKKIYKKIKWSSNRYGIETEIATKIGKGKLPFKEIEIETIYLDKKHGINWKDGIKILLKIPVWYFNK